MTDSDLEVCRVTALALYPHAAILSGEVWAWRKWPDLDDDGGIVKWNPLEIPAQMAECVDKLLSLGYWLALDGRDGRYHQSFGRDGVDEGLSSNCPWHEFPARALAMIWRKE